VFCKIYFTDRMGSVSSQDISDIPENANDYILSSLIMDKILQFMITELKITDLNKLSNPETCRQYVMLMSNHLYTHFSRIQLYPYTSNETQKRSEVLFRKVSDLINPPSREMIEDRQRTCLILAYYFTRIFQIYGAIAITLFSNMDRVRQISEEDRALDPFHRPVTRQVVRGGVVEHIGLYEFIEPYIQQNISYTSNKGYKLQYPVSSNHANIFFIAFNNIEERGLSQVQRGSFRIELLSIDKVYNLSCSFELRSDTRGDTRTISFGYITTKIDNRDVEQSIRLPTPTRIIKRNAQFSIDRKAVNVYFNELFTRIIIDIHRSRRNRTRSNSNESERETSHIPYLGITTLKKYLQEYKPIGHCLARALQLLPYELVDNKDTVSNICKATFGVRETGIQLPVAGNPIINTIGYKTEEALFHVLQSTPQLFDRRLVEQYIKFLRSIALPYKKYDNPEGILANRFTNIRNIKNDRNENLCRGSNNQEIFIPHNTGIRVKTIVDQLIDIQLEHAKKCGNIIRRLFKFARNAQGEIKIYLSDAIRDNGFVALEAISHDTRELLINYYSNCESKYLEGVQIVNTDKKNPSLDIGRVTARNRIARRYREGVAASNPVPIGGSYQ